MDSAVEGRGLASTLERKLPINRTALGNSHTFAEGQEVSPPAPRTTRWKSSPRLVDLSEHGEQEPRRRAHRSRHQRPAAVVERFVAARRGGHKGKVPAVETDLAVDRHLAAAGSGFVDGTTGPVDTGTIAAASRGHDRQRFRRRWTEGKRRALIINQIPRVITPATS